MIQHVLSTFLSTASTFSLKGKMHILSPASPLKSTPTVMLKTVLSVQHLHSGCSNRSRWMAAWLRRVWMSLSWVLCLMWSGLNHLCLKAATQIKQHHQPWLKGKGGKRNVGKEATDKGGETETFSKQINDPVFLITLLHTVCTCVVFCVFVRRPGLPNSLCKSVSPFSPHSHSFPPVLLLAG